MLGRYCNPISEKDLNERGEDKTSETEPFRIPGASIYGTTLDILASNLALASDDNCSKYSDRLP